MRPFEYIGEIADLREGAESLARQLEQVSEAFILKDRENAKLRAINAELLAALKLWMTPYSIVSRDSSSSLPYCTSNLIEQSSRAIAKAEGKP